MKTTLITMTVVLTFCISTAFITSNVDPIKPYTHNLLEDIKGPCDCEKGWNFIVHQITPEGCRQKSIYCTEDVELEPGYSCGTCPKPCSTCPTDEKGDIMICRVFGGNKAVAYQANCSELQNFFTNQGDFKNSKDHCGPCTCEDEGDQDTDGDGVCDKKDGCPNDPTITESGPCGCEDQDTDGDGVCDKEDECPSNPIKSLSGACGCEDQDTDGDGICDSEETPSVCDVSGNNQFEWIESVVINGVNNRSGSNDNGYASFTSNAIAIASGDVLSVWINPGHADAVCELSYGIFVDWNQDGDFKDQGEMVLNERGIEEKGIDYQLPSDLNTGKYTMRIMVDLGRIWGACGGCIDGESEDYLIDITESSCTSVYEGFDYPKDVSLSDKDGGKGWGDSWKITKEGDAYADIIEGPVPKSALTDFGNKLGVLNRPGSRIKISRDLSQTLFQKSGDLWLSFVYVRDQNTVFSPEINGQSTGLYISTDGFLIIGGLKTLKLDTGTPYTFLLKASLNAGTDMFQIEVNPSSDGSSLYSQSFNANVDGQLNNLGFEFWSAGSNEVNTSQYLDEISIGCTKEEVLSFRGDDDLIISEAESASELRVYPNPLQKGQTLVIEWNGKEVTTTSYSLFNANGTLMKSGELTFGENEINTDDLSSGVYFVEVITSAGLVRERLVVQNDG